MNFSDNRASYTINEFCARNGISRRYYYQMRYSGTGPREFALGKTWRISRRAEADWIRRCEMRTKNGAKNGREQDRPERVGVTSTAGSQKVSANVNGGRLGRNGAGGM